MAAPGLARERVWAACLVLTAACAEDSAPQKGEADVAKALTAHNDIDGILFTGSWPVGRKILEANLDHAGRIVALEMGGNSPMPCSVALARLAGRSESQPSQRWLVELR